MKPNKFEKALKWQMTYQVMLAYLIGLLVPTALLIVSMQRWQWLDHMIMFGIWLVCFAFLARRGYRHGARIGDMLIEQVRTECKTGRVDS